MEIVLYEQQQMSKTYLPEKVNGKYWVEHYNPQNRKERFLGIEAHDGIWYLVSTKQAFLLNEQLEPQTRVELPSQELAVPIQARRTGEQSILVCENRPLSRVYKKFKIEHGAELTIGSDLNNDLVLSGTFIAPFHARLTYHNNTFSVTALDEQYGIYVNTRKMLQTELVSGDILCLMGTNIIVGTNFLAINNLDIIQQMNSTVILEYPQQQRIEVDDNTTTYIDDMDSGNLFFRSPRFKRDIEPKQMNLDAPPAKRLPDEIPAILSMGPAVTMGTAAMFTAWYSISNTLNSGGDISAAMPSVVMAGSMLAGSLLWPVLQRGYNKKQAFKLEKTRKKKYYAYLEKVKGLLEQEASNQTEILNENLIALEDCLQRIELRARNLWERMPEHNDFLTLRLGIGILPLYMNFNSQSETFSLEEDELQDAMHLLAKAPRVLKDVPIPLSLQENFITGIVGPRQNCIAFTYNMIFQLAALHSYTDLKMVFLYDESEKEQWDFVRWLPHTWNDQKSIRYVSGCDDSLKALCAYFEQRFSAHKSDDNPQQVSSVQFVFFCTNRLLAKRADMLKHILEMKQYEGYSLILLYDELRHLPKECDIVIEMGEEPKIFNRRDISGQVQTFVADTITFEPRKYAVALSNIKLDQDEKVFALPNTMTFLEMYRAEKIEHLNPLERWKENNPVLTLRAPIGIGESGELFYLDLHEKYHGPHGLIAGMTGSGKSEFIMTYILSLALNYHPHEVAFILIDYKGGGMANAFSNLPHLAGTITNLDGAAVNRSLVSIESELKRRQSIFSETSKKVDVSNIDIYKYQKLFREGLVEEPLQHLFIISDEFAELKTQQPEFMEQLVSAARIGRSLGIHLILATQKPSGVVDDQIWSNSRFRICLKVQEESDSRDVIKRPDAAALSVTGRYYVQVGFDEVFELGQSAWGGAPYLPGEEQAEPVDDTVVFIDEVGRVLHEVKPPKKAAKVKNPPKQLDEITKYLNRLAAEEHIAIKPLWLEPIPAVILQNNTEHKYMTTATPFMLKSVLGEYDNPAAQSQNVFVVPLSSAGNIAVYGSAGNGKTTFLSTLIYATIKQHTAQEVQFYILDFSAETLKSFLPAPQVGDVVFAGEEEKVDNLFRMVTKELTKRKKQFVDYGGDYESYIRANPQYPVPHMFVIIHNYSVFYEMYESYADEQLVPLTRDCVKYGITFIFTSTGVSDLRYKLEQNIGRVYAMQLNDPSDYSTIFPVRESPALAHYKGRGLFYEDGELFEFQTAYAFEPETIFQEIHSFCQQLKAEYDGPVALPIPILPEICSVEYLQTVAVPDNAGVPIGVDRISLDVIYRSFSDFLSAVFSDIAETKYLMQSIADMYHGKQADVQVVLGSDEFLGDLPYPCAQSRKELAAFTEEFFDTMVDRHNQYKTAEQEGTDLPVFPKKVYVIHDMMALFEKLEELDATRLEKTLMHGNAAYNIHLVASFANPADVIRTDWYKKHGSIDTYIWVGSGINDQYSLKISGSSSELRQEVPDDFGYVVDKTKYKFVKLVVPNALAQLMEE